MSSAGGVEYTWDANGNLLNDGGSTYTYDPANRMSSVTQGNNSYTYSYNGLGDRLKQTVNGQRTDYTLDLNAGLTQVLDDGTNSCTYGVDRISQQHGSTAEYFLGDALGSVRQLTDANSAITLTKSYDPYGNVISSAGSSTSLFGYTGEQGDSYIKLINLRSRLYSPDTGRYLTKDSWQGDYNRPLSLNQWNYVEGNPVNYVDPSGYIKESEAQDAWDIMMELKQYQVKIVVDWGYTDNGVLRTLLPVSPDRAKLYGWGCLSWTEGLWTLDDMQAFENGIAIIRRGVTNAGGNYQTLVGAVTVVRQRGNPPTTGAPTINYKVDGASRTYKVYGAIHEMGHIIIGHEAATLNYFKSKLQTSMENGIYNPGPYKGSSSEIYGYTHMPSKYAINNSAEDFAETFREVVVHRYLDSPENKFPNEFNDATSEYDATGIGNPSGVPFNHDIGERLAVMQQIISGNWVTIRHE